MALLARHLIRGEHDRRRKRCVTALETCMDLLPKQSDSRRSAKLMSLDCESLGRMVRGMTLHAVAEHFACVGEASQAMDLLSHPGTPNECNGGPSMGVRYE